MVAVGCTDGNVVLFRYFVIYVKLSIILLKGYHLILELIQYLKMKKWKVIRHLYHHLSENLILLTGDMVQKSQVFR